MLALLFHEDRDWLTLCVKIQSPVSEWAVLPSIISNQVVEFYFTDRPQVLFFFPSSSNVFTRGCVDFYFFIFLEMLRSLFFFSD